MASFIAGGLTSVVRCRWTRAHRKWSTPAGNVLQLPVPSTCPHSFESAVRITQWSLRRHRSSVLPCVAMGLLLDLGCWLAPISFWVCFDRSRSVAVVGSSLRCRLTEAHQSWRRVVSWRRGAEKTDRRPQQCCAICKRVDSVRLFSMWVTRFHNDRPYLRSFFWFSRLLLFSVIVTVVSVNRLRVGLVSTVSCLIN